MPFYHSIQAFVVVIADFWAKFGRDAQRSGSGQFCLYPIFSLPVILVTDDDCLPPHLLQGCNS